MADEQNLDAPIQETAVRRTILEKSSAGGISAVGLARAAEVGDQKERIGNLDSRGSTQPVAGGDAIKADYPDFTPGAPVGAQAQPANYTTNGTLPVGMVGSPTGPVPASSVTADPAEARKRIQENLDSQKKHVLRSGFEQLSRDKIESMSPADLRAVASDRGYDVGLAGARVTRRRFLAEQTKDASENPADFSQEEPTGEVPET
jgi:hypothetical protein